MVTRFQRVLSIARMNPGYPVTCTDFTTRKNTKSHKQKRSSIKATESGGFYLKYKFELTDKQKQPCLVAFIDRGFCLVAFIQGRFCLVAFKYKSDRISLAVAFNFHVF